MVALLIIVDIGLPIAVDKELEAATEVGPRRRRPFDHVFNRTEPLDERRCLRIQAHEDEAAPDLDGDREQRQRVFREVRRLAEQGHMIEGAVGAVAPAVIGAFDGAAISARLGE